MKEALLGSAVLLVPVAAWAGLGQPTAPQPVPALDEAGLLVLVAGLVGAGLALVRRRGGGAQ